MRVLLAILLILPALAGCADGDEIHFTEVWEFPLPRVGFASPLVVDLDGDGVLDVVAAAGPWSLVDSGAAASTKDIVALRGGDGSLLWTLETGHADSSPAAADLDGDGSLDIAMGLRQRGQLAVLGAAGTVERTRALDNWVHTPAIADADGNGSPDLFVVTGGLEDAHQHEPGDPGGRGNAGQLLALRGADLEPIWAVDLPEDAYSSPAVGPLGARGGVAVVHGAGGEMDFGGAIVVRAASSGDLLWTEETRTGVVASPAIANLDGDGRADVVFVEWWGEVHARSGAGAKLWDAPTGYLAFTSPALGHLNGDDRHDVVVSGLRRADHHENDFDFLVNGEGALSYASQALVRALDGVTGRTLWSREFGGAPSSPVTADLTGDGQAEVIVILYNGKSGVMGTTGGRLVVLDGASGATLATHKLPSGAAATPTVTDIDSDGYPDIIIATTAPARVLRLESDTLSEPSVVGAWPMWRANLLNTGNPVPG